MPQSKKIMCVSVGTDLHAAIAAYAQETERSASSVVRLAVRRLLADS